MVVFVLITASCSSKTALYNIGVSVLRIRAKNKEGSLVWLPFTPWKGQGLKTKNSTVHNILNGSSIKGGYNSSTNRDWTREEVEEGLKELQPMEGKKGRIQLERTNSASRNIESSRLEGKIGWGLTMLEGGAEGRVREWWTPGKGRRKTGPNQLTMGN